MAYASFPFLFFVKSRWRKLLFCTIVQFLLHECKSNLWSGTMLTNSKNLMNPLKFSSGTKLSSEKNLRSFSTAQEAEYSRYLCGFKFAYLLSLLYFSQTSGFLNHWNVASLRQMFSFKPYPTPTEDLLDQENGFRQWGKSNKWRR